MTWLLLLHQIPPKPPYFRAKVLRRLTQVGALPIKNSAYLLPASDDTREDFEWILQEIVSEGGAAWLFEAEALGGLSEEQAADAFRKLRDADYAELLASADEWDLAKLTARFEEVKKIDFFEHASRGLVEAAIAEKQAAERGTGAGDAAGLQGRVWVTRTGIKVDRIGSAWLIRRFIDPQGTFRFVDPATYKHLEGELRFDMFEGEFTHEGELCTFEVLITRHNLLSIAPGLKPIAEMVHDIDLKDSYYQRPETAGFSRMLDGVCARHTSDEARLAEASTLFESLLESFSE